jgi:hypothetical protein
MCATLVHAETLAEVSEALRQARDAILGRLINYRRPAA